MRCSYGMRVPPGSGSGCDPPPPGDAHRFCCSAEVLPCSSSIILAIIMLELLVCMGLVFTRRTLLTCKLGPWQQNSREKMKQRLRWQV
ncbi:unnamed protein product [Merluccius merluccius]